MEARPLGRFYPALFKLAHYPEDQSVDGEIDVIRAAAAPSALCRDDRLDGPLRLHAGRLSAPLTALAKRGRRCRAPCFPDVNQAGNGSG